MEKDGIENDDFSLRCTVNQDDIIMLTAAGRMTNEKRAEFSAWTNDVKKCVCEIAKKHPDSVLLLSNVSGVGHFESDLLDDLKSLFDHNKEFVTKSAIVGAHRYLGLLIDAVAKFTGRTNIRQFASNEEAIAWLLVKEGQPPA